MNLIIQSHLQLIIAQDEITKIPCTDSSSYFIVEIKKPSVGDRTGQIEAAA